MSIVGESPRPKIQNLPYFWNTKTNYVVNYFVFIFIYETIFKISLDHDVKYHFPIMEKGKPKLYIHTYIFKDVSIFFSRFFFLPLLK